jgi:hypothetical protein
MDKLKLYVLGEDSADPTKWDGTSAHAIVIAHNPEEAKRLAPEAQEPVKEIQFDKAKVLLFSPGSPGWED